MARNSGNGSDERTPSNDGSGQVPRAMNAVTARRDNFSNALTQYGNGARDLLGNITGPTTANSGVMEYFGNVMANKQRVAALSDSLLQKPREQGRSLAEIDAAMRADELALQGDIQKKELQQKSDIAEKDIFEVASEAASTLVALDKGLRAFTKASGDEEMAYDPKKWEETYKNYIEQAKAQGIDLESMPPEEAAQYYEFFNSRSLDIAKGEHKSFSQNPAAWVADQIASGLEVLPGLKKMRRKAVATAEAERVAEKSRATPEMTDAMRRLVQNHFEAEGKTREEATAYFNLLGRAALTAAAANGLSVSETFFDTFFATDGAGQPVPGITSFTPGLVAVTPTPRGPNAPDPNDPGAPASSAVVNFGTSHFAPLFGLIVQKEAGMFKDPYNAFNRGAAADSMTVMKDANGNVMYRSNGISPKMRVIEADEIWGKKITDMSVSELQGYMVTKEPGKEIKAAGAIQMTEIFLKDAVAKGIVKPDDVVDRDTQMKLGVWSLTDKHPEIGSYLDKEQPTSADLVGAARGLSREYETFADPTTGYSFYDTNGNPYNPNDPNSHPKVASVSHTTSMQTLEEVRGLKRAGAKQGESTTASESRQDQIVMDILQANKDKDLVRRILQPDAEREHVVHDNGDGTTETRSHYMTYSSVTDKDGKEKWAVYANVMPELNMETTAVGQTLNTRLKDFSLDGTAWETAKARKEYILFDTQAEADWWSKNYRRFWGRK
jgi:hypothetical protein